MGYSVVSGTLPPGLALDGPSGFIAGIPTQAGNFPFVLQFVGVEGVSGDITCSIFIVASGGGGGGGCVNPTSGLGLLSGEPSVDPPPLPP